MSKPKCKLLGENGNIFNLVGIAARTLKLNNQPDRANEMMHRITQGEAKNYSEALAIICEYVDVY